MDTKHEPSRPIFLDGPRIYLTPIEERDVDLLTKWINDPDARKYLSRRLPMQTHQELGWIKGTTKDEEIHLLIMLKAADGQDMPIGTIGVFKVNRIHGTCETGTNIGDKKSRGKGFGTEAKMIFLNYLFNWLNLRKICSTAYSTNIASQKYSAKCGYRTEGVLKKHIYHNGVYVDLVQLAVFKEDFMPLWEQFNNKNPGLK